MKEDIAVIVTAVTRYLEIPIEEDWVIDVMHERDKKRGFESIAPNWKWALDLDFRQRRTRLWRAEPENDKMTSWRQATFNLNRLQSR